MRCRAQRCSTVVLILLVFLVPAALQAAPARGPERPVAEHSGGGFFDLVRSVLAVVFGRSGGIAGRSSAAQAGDNGSGFDPDGNRLMGDNGSWIDPNG